MLASFKAPAVPRSQGPYRVGSDLVGQLGKKPGLGQSSSNILLRNIPQETETKKFWRNFSMVNFCVMLSFFLACLSVLNPV